MGLIKQLYHTTPVGETDQTKEKIYPITATTGVYSPADTGAFPSRRLDQVISSLNEGYQYLGVAVPTTNPGTFDHKVFYLASQSGTYSYFNNLVVSGLTVLRNNGSGWVADYVGIGGGEGGGITLGYIGTTPLQGGPVPQDLTGISNIYLENSARIYFGSGDSSFIELTNDGFHFSRGIYSDYNITAGGVHSGGEEGGGTIEETDPVFRNSPAFGITAEMIDRWENGTGGGGGNLALQEGTGITITSSSSGGAVTKTISLSSAYQTTIANLVSYFDSSGNANNALALDGHPASYFATAAALSGIDTRLQAVEDWFEIVNGNLHVKNGRGLYSDSFISAGGTNGTGGGNAGTTLASLNDVFSANGVVLKQNGQALDAGDVLTYGNYTENGVSKYGWFAAPSGGGGGGTGSVISIGMTGGTGLDVTVAGGGNNPITSSGTFNISINSGYTLPAAADWTSVSSKANSAYQLPPNGIPASVMDSAVQTALGKANTAVQPADIANFVTVNVDNLVNYYKKSETYTRAEIEALLGAHEFFEEETYTENNATKKRVKLKTTYKGLYAEGWIVAGGVNNSASGGSGGGGASYLWGLNDVYSSNGVIRNQQGGAVSAGDTLIYGQYTDLTTGNSVTGWYAGANAQFNPLGSSVTDRIGITLSGEYHEVLTAHQSLAGLVPITRTINGASLANDISLYLGTTYLQTSPSPQAITGITLFTNNSAANVSGDTSLVKWENNAWHFYGNIYADGYISAAGIGSSSSNDNPTLWSLTDIYSNSNVRRLDGSSVESGDVLIYGQYTDLGDNNRVKWGWYASPAGTGGSIASIIMNGTSFNAVNGVINLGTVLTQHQTLDLVAAGLVGTTHASQVIDGYVYINLVADGVKVGGVKIVGDSTTGTAVTANSGTIKVAGPSLANYVTKTGADTISGQKTFTNTVIIDSSSSGLLQLGTTQDIFFLDTTETLEDILADITDTLSGKQSTVSALGSTTQPVYISGSGTFAACSAYAGGTAVTLNGTPKGATTAAFYAPELSGNSGQYLLSGGTGNTPTWSSKGSIASNDRGLVDGGTVYTKLADYQLKVTALGNTTEPVYISGSGTFAKADKYAGGTLVNLNSQDINSAKATFYAPIGSGDSGQYLVSGGSGTAPSWTSIGSIASGNTGLVTGGTVYSYITSKYLPLTGGTLHNTSSSILKLKNTSSNEVDISFINATATGTLGVIKWDSTWGMSLRANNASGAFAGQIGVKPDGTPYYAHLSNWTEETLIHTGNYKDLTALDLYSVGLLDYNQNLNTIYNTSYSANRGRFRFYSNTLHPAGGNTAGVNGFPAINDSNALITVDTYNGGTSAIGLYQLGFSGNSNLYYRYGFGYDNDGTWIEPFSGVTWRKLAYEDSNGDLTITRHLILAKGNALKLDLSGDAYIKRGSGEGQQGDYALYVNAGHLSDGTTRATTHFEASALCPESTAAAEDLGISGYSWNNLWARRWYPNPGDSSHYIEWDSNATAFKIVGNVYATGQVAAGGVASSS